MASDSDRRQRYTTTVIAVGKRVFVPIPFDPDDVWGAKPEHHVHGTVNGMGLRGVIEPAGDGVGIVLGPAWRRDCGVDPGDDITVELAPEGPQRDDLSPDLRAAFDADPDAGAFFDSLAQFYRVAYLRWIDAAKRRPELRPQRIAEVVQLLNQGIKQRPDT